MKIKNPLRTYINWYGRNMVEIAEEPAGRALAHYGKFAAKNIAIGVAATVVVYGAFAVGYMIKDKIDEIKENKE